jgi:hypothetical protein
VQFVEPQIMPPHDGKKLSKNFPISNSLAEHCTPSSSMADRVTRASNANAHLGMVDRNAPRCSKEEVQAEKEAKAAAKERAASEKIAKIEKVAAIEKAAKQKAKDMDQEANDPVDPVTQTKARKSRKRPRAEDEDEGYQQPK